MATALDFPNAPGVNQIFTSGQASWQWDGVKWIAAPAGGSSVTPPTTVIGVLTLYYVASANQLSFNLSNPDRFGHSYNLVGTELLDVAVNGNRLALDDGTGFGGYTVNYATNTVNLLAQPGAGSVIIFDVYGPQAPPVIPAGQLISTESLLITTSNVIPNLGHIPNGQMLDLFINGMQFSAAATNPAFKVVGNVFTWLSTLYSVNPGDTVICVYTHT